MRPSASSAKAAWVMLSRPWKSVRKPSLRSAVQRTGRPVRMAAQGQSTASGWTRERLPNPPPTSGQTTSICEGGTFSAAAMSMRWRTTP